MAAQDRRDPGADLQSLRALLLKQRSGQARPAPEPHRPVPERGQTARQEPQPASTGRAAPPASADTATADIAADTTPLCPPPLRAEATQSQLHHALLQRLETGQIHPDEMRRFHAESRDATVMQELTWILFSIEQLEKHRLRLVEHLRSQREAA